MVTDNIQIWATGVGITLVVGILLRAAKKNKWSEKIRASGVKVGIALSVALLGWLPRKKAEEAEEGFIVTAINWISQFLTGIEEGMLKDNAKKVKKASVLILGLCLVSLFSSCSKKVTIIDYPSFAEFDQKPPVEPVVDGEVGGVLSFGIEPEPKPEPVVEAVMFEFDSYKISPKYQMMLDKIDILNRSVYLTGSTCPIGPEVYNYKLARERAVVVGKYLQKVHGASDIRVSSVGETDRYSKNTRPNEQLELNRRCSIIIN